MKKILLDLSQILLVSSILFVFGCKSTRPTMATNQNSSTAVQTQQQTIIGVDSLTLNNDSILQNIANIIANKQKYVNKPLQVLLTDLSFPVRSFGILNSNMKEITGLRLSFYDRQTTSNFQVQKPNGQAPPYLFITWKDPIPAGEFSNQVVDQGVKNAEWPSAASTFFSPKTVADIQGSKKEK